MAAVHAATQVLERPVAHGSAAEGIARLIALAPPGEADPETPERVVRAFREMISGYAEDPKQILSMRVRARNNDLVVLTNIAFTSLCRHHLMPFSGVAHVGYIPDGWYVGLSKLARIVDCFARRLQLQEDLSSDIEEALVEHVTRKGVAVVLEASHGCLSCRGAHKPGAMFVTSSMHGRFREVAELRAEFFAVVRR